VKIQRFSSFKRQYLENGSRYGQSNTKSYMGFRLTPRSMTFDDLELHKFEFSVNFARFCRFRT